MVIFQLTSRKALTSFFVTLLVAAVSMSLATPVNASTTKQVIIHYQKVGATTFEDYKDLDFYFWNGLNGDFAPNGNDSFGKIWTLSVDTYAVRLDGLIKTGWQGDWSNKDGGETANRSISLNDVGPTELWLVSGLTGSVVFTSVAHAISSGGATEGALISTGVDPNYECVDEICQPVSATFPATQSVTIHYNRPNATGFNSYKDWQIFSFDLTSAWWNGSDEFGKVYTRTLTNASTTSTFKFIIKTPNWDKDSCSSCSGLDAAERTINLEKDGSTEVWVVSGSSAQYYTSAGDASAAGAVVSPWAAGAEDPNFTCNGGVCLPKPTTYPATQTLTIHYNRPNGDYGPWNLWLWGTKIPGSAYNFDSQDSFGKKFTWSLTNAQENAVFGFVVRTNQWDKDTYADRSVSVDPSGDGVYEIWLKQGDPTIYTRRPAAPKSIAITGKVETDRQVSISFDVSSEISAVTNIEYSTNGGYSWRVASPTQTMGPLVIRGLLNGNTYSVLLRAVYADGTKLSTSSYSVTPHKPVGTPSKMEIKSILISPSTKNITVNAGFVGGNRVPLRSIQYSLNDGATWQNSSQLTSPFRFSNLNPNSYYTLRMRATSVDGTGESSSPIQFLTPSLPGTCGIKSIKLMKTSAVVNFETNVTQYSSVSVQLSSGGNYYSWSNTGKRNSPFVLTGLNRFSDYQMRIRLTNAWGSGPESAWYSFSTS